MERLRRALRRSSGSVEYCEECSRVCGPECRRREAFQSARHQAVRAWPARIL